MTSPQARADSVRAALASTSTCTLATVTLLSDLLSPKVSVQGGNDTENKIPTTKGVGTRQSRTTKRPKPETKITKSQLDGKCPEAELSPKEKAILATEVINVTLKTLSSPAKIPKSVRRQPSTTDLADGPRRRVLRRSTSLPQSPLQPRSLNRVSSSPNIETRSSRSSSSASITLSCYRATAECSRLAFACMRILQSSKASCMMDMPPLQLETGMSALIGRLIALGLEDLALKELRILKRRIEGISKAPCKEEIKNNRKLDVERVATTSGANQTLTDLLEFEVAPEGGAVLSLTISIQLHVLKLMVLSRKPSVIIAALPKLIAENGSSPNQLLLRSSRESPAQAGRAARQLETLSQLLLSLCPNISTSEDSAAVVPNLSTPSEVAFELQTLAFQCRLMWWKLSGHRGDVDNDVLGPFSRCLAAFARRSQCNVSETYEYASQGFQKIYDATSECSWEQVRHANSQLNNTYRLLSSLAQDAGCFHDAIKWLKPLHENNGEVSISEVQSCAIAASMTTLKLLLSPKNVEVEELLVSVLEGIEGPLKGESAELDELLSAVSKLRRAAVSLLYKRDPNSKHNTTDIIPDGVRQMCESLIFLCPRLSIRYLGKRPDPNSAAKSIVRHEQRRQFVAKSGFHAIDSAIFLIKTFQSEKRLTWDLMDSTLQDCLRLLEGIGENHVECSNESITVAASYFVRISHLYYTQHLNMRRDAQGPKDFQHIRPLRRSIDSVSSRSIPEKKTAFVNSKLERLAELYKMVGRQDEARETLAKLGNDLIESGVLSVIATAGNTKPVRTAWEESDETSMLARVTALLLKLESRSEPNSLRLPLYDVARPAQEKGMLLEHLLNVLSRQTSDSQNMRRKVVIELLAIYDPQQFPVRRLRIVTHLLRLDFDQRCGLINDVRNTLAIANLQTIIEQSEDFGLLPYLSHLQALASSALELQESHPRVDLLKPHLASWCSTLEACKDYEALAQKVDDVSELLNHLTSIADFLHMKGFVNVRTAVLKIIANLNEISRPESCPDDVVSSYICLGLQYLELGYSGKAGLAFDRAQSYASCNGVTPEALIRMHLSYSEYSLEIGNAEKSEESLLRAQAIASQNPDMSIVLKSSGTLSRRVRLAGLAAEACLAHSIFALERGASETALGQAKRSVRLFRYSWMRMTVQAKSKPEKSEGHFVDNLSDDVLDLSISTTTGPISAAIHEQLPGPTAWALVYPLFRSLTHLSKVYAYHGMFQETLYYAEQAHKLVMLVDSGPYIAMALAATGSTWLSAGKLDKASELLVRAKELSLSSGDSQILVLISCHLGKLHGQLADRQAELAAYENASSTLETLTSVKYINEIDRINDSAAILEQEMSRLTLKVRKTKEPHKAAASKKTSTKKGLVTPKPVTEAQHSISEECRRLASLKGFLFREKASALMLLKRCEDAIIALREADGFARSQVDFIDQHMVTAKQLFLQSVEHMSSDPVYSVLQDSTISFPAVLPSKVQGTASEKPPGTRLSPPRKLQANSTSRSRHRSGSPSPQGFFDKLRQAQEHLTEAHSAAVHVSSTAVIHSLSSLLSAVAILLSAAGPSSSMTKNVAHSNFATCSMEFSRNIALQREHRGVLSDPSTSSEENVDLQWPILTMVDPRQSNNVTIPDVSHFQKEYIDIIPQGWTIISIALSENRQEICLTKMQASQSPFLLRLPLGRNNSRDVDEEVFDFAQGKAELLEIIELANCSAHSAKDVTGRGAKTAWWEERDALDARLKDLLVNIETVWLGGFKGIFSQHRPRPDLLARFQKSFQNILDKHLPSRQNTAKKGKTTRVTLDGRILELFIGLQHASSENCDNDEALTDLLYFVVDILQFHGERNAYDEIDFDSIVIETHDALRSYHQEVLVASTGKEDKHTVLILDKALHAFPWESLPCMDGLAVSRLPSLACLRERLLQQHNSSGRRYLDRMNGGYVLNPGGDLQTTQTAFEANLQSLNNWEGIVKREPSESEMKDSLESKDVFLYFGHGSGAQYIRSKAIKRLKQCAVTILMGCSSGALTEAGEFESYGPPIDYMLAGCPALVATLWDVTDKDIDRFARSTFERWGLFTSQTEHKGSTINGKGEMSASQTSTSREEISLVRAVAEGRKACNFRYLTAAAVCVYGIPVYLK